MVLSRNFRTCGFSLTGHPLERPVSVCQKSISFYGKEAGNLWAGEGAGPYKDTPMVSPPLGSQWTWLGVSL